MLLPADSALLDFEVIEALRSLSEPGEPDMFAEVVQVFLAEAPGQFAALSAAMAAGDAAAAWPMAHRLRGSALGVGASRMASHCDAIEQAAHTGSFEEAIRLFETLPEELAAACGALQRAIA